MTERAAGGGWREAVSAQDKRLLHGHKYREENGGEHDHSISSDRVSALFPSTEIFTIPSVNSSNLNKYLKCTHRHIRRHRVGFKKNKTFIIIID